MKIGMLLLTFWISIISPYSLALANEDAKHPIEQKWPFEGFFGKVNRSAVQRGFQVYKEICSNCHSLKKLAYRNLSEIGFTENEIKALAAGYCVVDGPNDEGEMFERPGRPSDIFVAPFKNDKAARFSNNGALPPDLSLIIKAREDGANYVYSILNGYNEPKPDDIILSPGQHYNPYMPGGKIAMPPPLSNGLVQYIDGTESTVSQMSKDVVNFLQWAAEPEMEKRKFMGLRTTIYLLIFIVLFYIAKKRIWSDVK